MRTIGFHASHELYSPSKLIRLVQRAEQAGFQGAMCSDHFHPWTPTQGQSGFSFAWLGAALQVSQFPIGTVCCPAFRYHPAVVAQAAATLAEMFPRRFWLAIGTGQALNEHITGERWPEKSERRRRVEAAAGLIRQLWRGELVSHGTNPTVKDARLFTLPSHPPLLFGAAMTPQTAKWVGGWADGLLTAGGPKEALRDVVAAFREGGGGGKPMYLQSAVGYASKESVAWDAATRVWPIAALEQDLIQNLETPEEFATAARRVSPSEIRGRLRVSSDLRKHADWLAADLELGFDSVFLHPISDNAEQLLDAFAEHVLPAVE